MIRFSLITAPVIVLAGKYIKNQGYVFISLIIFFVLSSATAAGMMLNSFGYDGAGIRRYAVLPMHFGDALRAINLSSLLLRGIVVLVSFALWLMIYSGNSPTLEIMVIMISTALAGLFLYNGIGFWISVLSPKTMEFDAMWNNRLSFVANMVIFGGAIIPFWGLNLLARHAGQESMLRQWWFSVLVLITCIGFYVLSFQTVETILKTRRERLINLIAGARDR